MARPIGIVFPLGGLASGVLALALWLSALSLRWLDAVVAVLFALGLGLSIVGYSRGRDLPTRRFAIVGVGCNALGLVVLSVLYVSG
jgi:hypothetical protein